MPRSGESDASVSRTMRGRCAGVPIGQLGLVEPGPKKSTVDDSPIGGVTLSNHFISRAYSLCELAGAMCIRRSGVSWRTINSRRYSTNTLLLKPISSTCIWVAPGCDRYA